MLELGSFERTHKVHCGKSVDLTVFNLSAGDFPGFWGIPKRIEAKSHDGNRVYAAEILSILLDNRPNRLAFGKADGVETSLKVLSVSDCLAV